MSWLRASSTRTVLSNGLRWRQYPCPRPMGHQLRWYSDQKPQENGETQPNEIPQSAESTEKSAEGSSEAEESPLIKELREKLKGKETEVVDLTGRLRYSQADYQNLQRIAKKEKEQTRDFAITRFATDLLDTVDVLSLALRSIPESYSSPPPSDSQQSQASTNGDNEKSPAMLLHELYQGVSLTNKQMLSTFSKYGITQFDPTGQKFDPNLHEAMYAVPMPDKEPGTVLESRKFGYMIKDRVLRAAQVGIVQEK